MFSKKLPDVKEKRTKRKVLSSIGRVLHVETAARKPLQRRPRHELASEIAVQDGIHERLVGNAGEPRLFLVAGDVRVLDADGDVLRGGRRDFAPDFRQLVARDRMRLAVLYRVHEGAFLVVDRFRPEFREFHLRTSFGRSCS